ncbi:MAG: glycosyltransferase family 4 protein [Cytophagaceae bacterium]|nr:glycosyltransferase family 4 protein [Cytophagaceae bacterium]MDW8455851.1 glycosyltransferase family 1 protein [Cytophagaceae bacterium]
MVESLKIAFDAKRAFNNSSGLGNYSRAVITSMLDNYCENEYFLFTTKKTSLYVPPVQAQVIMPRNGSGKLYQAGWRNYFCIHDIIKNRIDLYHGLSNELPLSIKSVRCKKIVTIHDVIFKRYPHFYNSIDRFIYTQKTRHACKAADKIVCISRQTKDDLIKFFNADESKINIIHPSYDPAFMQSVNEEMIVLFRKKYELNFPYLLCVGTVEKRKNQLNIVRAYHKAGLRDVILIIAGRHTEYARLVKKYVHENNLQDKIRFWEYVEPNDLLLLYKTALATIYLSVYEGFGLPVLESITAGTPVITSRVSSMPEAGGNAACYTDPYNTDEIAYAIKEVITSASTRSSMIEAGNKHITAFSPRATAEKMMRTYLSS